MFTTLLELEVTLLTGNTVNTVNINGNYKFLQEFIYAKELQGFS